MRQKKTTKSMIRKCQQLLEDWKTGDIYQRMQSLSLRSEYTIFILKHIMAIRMEKADILSRMPD